MHSWSIPKTKEEIDLLGRDKLGINEIDKFLAAEAASPADPAA